MANRSTQSTQPDSTAVPGSVHLPTSGTGQITPEEIARRAYELYEARGRTEGKALDDWLRAEGELTGPRES